MVALQKLFPTGDKKLYDYFDIYHYERGAVSLGGRLSIFVNFFGLLLSLFKKSISAYHIHIN